MRRPRSSPVCRTERIRQQLQAYINHYLYLYTRLYTAREQHNHLYKHRAVAFPIACVHPRYSRFQLLKGTSGGPRHCIWTPDCPLKLSCYLALDPPKGIHIVKSRSFLIFQGGYSKHMTSEIECFHRYWNSASWIPRCPLKLTEVSHFPCSLKTPMQSLTCALCWGHLEGHVVC